jgi:hypothetical protein
MGWLWPGSGCGCRPAAVAARGRVTAVAGRWLPDMGHGGAVPGRVGRLAAAEATGGIRRAVTATRLVVAWYRGCRRRKGLPPVPGESVP